MTLAALLPLAEEVSESVAESGGIPAWVVGVATFALLLAMLLAVVSFGGGREHS